MLTAHSISIIYHTKPVLKEVSFTVNRGERVGLIGPNGGGKTTLLRTIAGELPPLNGQIQLAPKVRLGYMSQEQHNLDLRLSPLEAIQHQAAWGETEARSFLHTFLFAGDDALRAARDLSYGERARLSLALLVAGGCNFLLLDEPINHLDIPSRTRFEQALARFDGAVLAVVHDRYFIQRFADELWVLDPERGLHQGL